MVRAGLRGVTGRIQAALEVLDGVPVAKLHFLAGLAVVGVGSLREFTVTRLSIRIGDE